MPDLTRKFGAIIKKYPMAYLLRRSMNYCAELVEKFILQKEYKPLGVQLFILGLPRSGTTLIYQYIVSRLKVAYFTNSVGYFPGAPCITTFVEHKVFGQYRSDFKSHYGKVIGPAAPREAGGFWIRFFDMNEYVNFNDLNEKDVYYLRNIIALISRIFGGAPFVNKNVKHLLRINALSNIFPESLFLVVERDMEDVALSILRGRYENLSDITQWWSVRPPNYTTLKNLPVIEQVAHQCTSLQSRMEKDLEHLPGKRVIRIRYEDFCKNPEWLIDRLTSNINAKKTDVSAQTSFNINHNEAQTPEEFVLGSIVKNLKDL